MKFMLIMNTPRDGYAQYMSWPKKVLEANIAFMAQFTKNLREAGELVSGEGLASPVQAKLVRAGADGKPITDGVFPESKEFLAGQDGSPHAISGSVPCSYSKWKQIQCMPSKTSRARVAFSTISRPQRLHRRTAIILPWSYDSPGAVNYTVASTRAPPASRSSET